MATEAAAPGRPELSAGLPGWLRGNEIGERDCVRALAAEPVRVPAPGRAALLGCLRDNDIGERDFGGVPVAAPGSGGGPDAD